MGYVRFSICATKQQTDPGANGDFTLKVEDPSESLLDDAYARGHTASWGLWVDMLAAIRCGNSARTPSGYWLQGPAVRRSGIACCGYTAMLLFAWHGEFLHQGRREKGGKGRGRASGHGAENRRGNMLAKLLTCEYYSRAELTVTWEGKPETFLIVPVRMR